MNQEPQNDQVRELIGRCRKLDELAGRIILTVVGQAAARCGRLAMFPLPRGSAGWHLYKLFDIGVDEYLAIDRRNLIDQFPGGTVYGGDVFPIHEARANAALMTPTLTGRNVLFMGRAVASAFGKTGETLDGVRRPLEVLDWRTDREDNYNFAIFPHTSRVSRWWNDPLNEKRARIFLRLTYSNRFYRGQA